MLRAPVAAAALIWLASCAGSPEVLAPRKRLVVRAPAPVPVDAAAAHTAAGPDARAAAPEEPALETTHLTEAQWRKKVGDKLSTSLGIPAADLRFSPMGTRVAVLQGPTPPAAGKKPKKGPQRFRILVVDSNGKRQALFAAVRVPRGEEPPADLRFLGEDRLVYEVPLPAPPERSTKRSTKRASKRVKTRRKAVARSEMPAAAAPASPGPPRRLFVIQPVGGPRRRPIRCDGVRFAFSRAKDRLAFVAGQPGREFVAVDGVQIYPRRGRSAITSDPAWSKDGQSIAFLEAREGRAPRLVMIPALDNPSGDTTWDLPAPTAMESLRVFWADEGRLVVGKSATKPVFSASFAVERPR